MSTSPKVLNADIQTVSFAASVFTYTVVRYKGDASELIQQLRFEKRTGRLTIDLNCGTPYLMEFETREKK